MFFIFALIFCVWLLFFAWATYGIIDFVIEHLVDYRFGRYYALVVLSVWIAINAQAFVSGIYYAKTGIITLNPHFN